MDAYGGPTAGNSYGMNARMYIDGGIVNATGNVASKNSYGLFGNIYISGGGVIALGGTADESSFGLFGFDTFITGGNVIATGGTADSKSCGICGYRVKIADTTIISNGGMAVESYGICGTLKIYDTEKTGTSVSISGEAYVDAAGSSTIEYEASESRSYGIYGYTTGDGTGVSITDAADVTSSGGRASTSYGIYGYVTGKGKGVDLSAAANITATDTTPGSNGISN